MTKETLLFLGKKNLKIVYAVVEEVAATREGGKFGKKTFLCMKEEKEKKKKGTL